MKIQISKIDDQYKLTTYGNGVEYIVYNSASWLVGDKIGNLLKAKYFPKKDTLEQSLKQWFSKQQFVSTGYYSVKIIAHKLGVSTRKVYSVLRNSDWCDAQKAYTSTRYGDCKEYYTYRYNG
jgi:hypothetical protein